MDLLTAIHHSIDRLPKTEVYVVKLGDTPVQIIKKIHNKGKTFVHLHENETTALRAAYQYVCLEGGTLITLKHTGQRNIVFYMGGNKYQFDPNRMFTDQGIKKTLSQFGHYSSAAHRSVKVLANRVKQLLPNGKIIAVHNNREYSMKDYLPSKPLARDAKELHYKPHSNYRNFYFVTLGKEYNRLKKQFNVALQSNHAQNDGSLSYYLANQNYINIEAGYGQLSAQLKMLYHA